MKELEGTVFSEPFPHLIIENFYDDEELDLIWEELKYYTKPGKLLEAEDFGGVVGKTNSHALSLDDVYEKQTYRSLSNILTVNRNLFTSSALDVFAEKFDVLCFVVFFINYTLSIFTCHDDY